jgi:hypothetical protein
MDRESGPIYTEHTNPRAIYMPANGRQSRHITPTHTWIPEQSPARQQQRTRALLLTPPLLPALLAPIRLQSWPTSKQLPPALRASGTQRPPTTPITDPGRTLPPPPPPLHIS